MADYSMEQQSAPRVAVIVLNYNGTEDTRLCLGSLRALDYQNVEVVLIDNGSSPPVGDLLATEFPWATVIQHSRNAGWAGGNNVGVQHALSGGAEYVVLLNNDTVVAPRLITRLLQALNQGFDIVGPKVNWMAEPGETMMDGCNFESQESAGFFDRPNIGPDPEITGVDIIYGCCLAVSASAFRTVGPFDERFFLIHEESDFCLRAMRLGFSCGVVPEALVWHKGSSSFKREDRPLQRYFDSRNILLLLWKHAGWYGRPRRRFRLWLKGLKHNYYFYCLSRERLDERGANAVLDGVYDALSGRFGPLSQETRRLRPLLRGAFELAKWAKARH